MITLSGIKVVELTTKVAGAYAGLIFADFGAEVIKIEDPKINPDRDLPTFKAANFVAHNRNKKSIRLNLKSEEGRHIFYQLAERADVILDPFRPGVVKRLSLIHI